MNCPACNGRRHERIGTQVFRCKRCGAIHGTVYLGELHQYVIMRFAPHDVPAERERYFDFTVLGSDGVRRVHGWYDPETKLLTQVG